MFWIIWLTIFLATSLYGVLVSGTFSVSITLNIITSAVTTFLAYIVFHISHALYLLTRRLTDKNNQTVFQHEPYAPTEQSSEIERSMRKSARTHVRGENEDKVTQHLRAKKTYTLRDLIFSLILLGVLFHFMLPQEEKEPVIKFFTDSDVRKDTFEKIGKQKNKILDPKFQYQEFSEKDDIGITYLRIREQCETAKEAEPADSTNHEWQRYISMHDFSKLLVGNTCKSLGTYNPKLHAWFSKDQKLVVLEVVLNIPLWENQEIENIIESLKSRYGQPKDTNISDRYVTFSNRKIIFDKTQSTIIYTSHEYNDWIIKLAKDEDRNSFVNQL